MATLKSTRRLFIKRLSLLGSSVALCIGAVPALAKKKSKNRKTNLQSIRISETHKDHTRVVFDLSDNVNHNVFSLEKPYRIVIDLDLTQKHITFQPSHSETNLLRSIRMGVRGQNDLRIVLDLGHKARPRSFILKPDGNAGYRLVVDLHATELSPTPIITSQQKRRKLKKQTIIAIDPGHGGRDPGAIGKKGTREKDITLAVGKKLKNIINRTQGFKAIMTRDADQYVVLRQRVKKAREHQADYFISLHADSFRSPKVEGASVYALSQGAATTEAAKWIAEKENASDLIGGISLDDKDDLIASVLLDLSQSATIQDSLELGTDVLKHLGKVGKLNNGLVQQAGFAVLKAPDMPSILIETAFLSNPKEERRLRNSKHQHKLAKAIFSGLKSHIKATKS